MNGMKKVLQNDQNTFVHHKYLKIKQENKEEMLNGASPLKFNLCTKAGSIIFSD